MMLEYLFFNEAIAECFIARLRDLGLEFEQSVESIEQATVIRIDEDSAEPHWDDLDELYDTLSAEDQAMLERAKGGMSVSGIYIQLSDGRSSVARVAPELLNRILSTVSMSEFNQLVEAIVSAVEHPDDGPLCKKVKP